jgi:hypothetical protein
MQEESLSVRFLGDNASLEKASKEAAKSLDKVEDAVDKTTKTLSKNINVTEKVSQAAAKLAKSSAVAGGSLDKTSKSSGAATQSLINLSRVAQDAPFGFIGIANNLNPLLESFQRLKAESGSTGTAMKALGSSLLGPAGIGLALGIVSSLLITFGDKLFKSKSAVNEQAEAIKKASQLLRDYEASLNDVSRVNLLGTQDAQGELTKLKALYDASQNINIPLAKRKEIVDQLQAQYPKYFKNLSDETILAGGAAGAYQNLTQAILASSKARAAQELIVEIQKDLLAVEQQITDNVAERTQLERNFVSQKGKQSPVRQMVDDFGRIVKTTTEADATELKINKKLEQGNKLYDQRFQLQKRINTVSSLLTDIVEKTPDALISPTSTLKDATSKKGEFNFFDKFFDFDFNGKLSEKQTSSLIDAANAFAKEFGGILEGLDFNKETKPASLQAAKDFWRNYRNGIVTFKPQKLIDDITVQAPAIKLADGTNQIEDLLKGIQQGFDKVNPNDVGVLPDALERQRIITLAKFEKLYRDIGLELPKIIKEELENGLSKPVEIKDIPTVNLDAVLKDNLQKATAFRNQLNAIFANSFQGLFSDLGSNIGKSIAEGLSPLTAATSTIVDFMSNLISQMGDALIQYGIIKTGIDKILLAGGFALPGGVAIALGIAAKAAASLLKSTKPKGFAEGGLAFGPTLGLVGEGRGTNRSNPEVIAPLNKLAQFIGGGSTGDTLVTRISGNDLELLLVRNGKRNGRVR